MGITVRSDKLLLVEGTHEQKFFKCLLGAMGIVDVQVEQVGGQHSFASGLKAVLSDPRFQAGKVTAIGFVRDADSGVADKFESIKSTLTAVGLPVPVTLAEPTPGRPHVSVFIAPDNDRTGSIEDLCLDIAQPLEVMGCATHFMECVAVIQGNAHPHHAKAKVQALLATLEEGDIHMGIAAEKGFWDWNSPALDTLKAYLRLL